MPVSEVVELHTLFDCEDCQVGSILLLLLRRCHVLDDDQRRVHCDRKRIIFLNVK